MRFAMVVVVAVLVAAVVVVAVLAVVVVVVVVSYLPEFAILIRSNIIFQWYEEGREDGGVELPLFGKIAQF